MLLAPHGSSLEVPDNVDSFEDLLLFSITVLEYTAVQYKKWLNEEIGS